MDEPIDPVKLSTAIAPQVNFAFHQNAVPVIREIELHNAGTTDLLDLVLEMHATPAFLAPKRWHIDRLTAGGLLHISDRKTQLDGGYLLGLQESQRGDLVFRLTCKDGQELISDRHCLVEVLARNEWGGFGSSPELLAAFCMPNDSVIDKLLRAASELLRRHGHDGTLHHYDKADPRRVWQQVAAVWNVLVALKLDYAYPPSSFERTGQKIRTPTAIVESRRATCLDSALLLAALFEQMRLHPLVVVEQGHAYVGVWLTKDGFHRPYSEDGQALRKRAQLRELVLLESTLLCQQQPVKVAIKQAEDRLAAEGNAFVGVLDIARARDERILPLSYAERPPVGDAPSPGPEGEGIDGPPEDVGRTATTQQQPDPGPAGRLANWQRKLLDLSLRNPLLNMKSSKTNIALIVPDPSQLEDRLAEGNEISIEPVPEHATRDAEVHAQQTGTNLDEEIARAALLRNKVYVASEATKLEASLVEIYRKSRNDLEEGGSNTLFLAIGALHWQRPESPDRVFRAPLILIPVTMKRQSVRSGIKIALSDDEPRFNSTLLEMLRQDFALDIKGLDGPLPQDGSGTDIKALLIRMRREIRDVRGFEVRDEAQLGTFSFAKYLMWKDLIDRTAQLKENAVVRHLIDTPKEPFRDAVDFVDPVTLDDQVDPASLFVPLGADSSQLAAVVSAEKGKNFVMIGPPGTGKSQTISNMISHNLGLGRTVLFVSEKAAALDVVHRRLKERGLGEFCLELHSNKARKLDVLKQLGEAWEARGELSESDWQDRARRLRLLRDQLNQVVRALHARHRNGLTIRRALALAAGKTHVPQVDLAWPDLEQHGSEDYQKILALGERMYLNVTELGAVKDHPLQILHTSEWSTGWQQAVLARALDLSAKARDWQTSIQQLVHRLKVPVDARDPRRLRAFSALASVLSTCAGHDLSFAFGAGARSTLEAMEKSAAILPRFQEQMSRLSCQYDRSALLKADLAPAQAMAQKAQTAWWLPRQINSLKCRGYLRSMAGARGKPDWATDLPTLSALQTLDRDLAPLSERLEKVATWRLYDTDLNQLTEQHRLATRLRAALTGLAENAEMLPALFAPVRQLVVDGNELLAPDGPIGAQLADFMRLRDEFNSSLEQFSRLAGQSADALLGEASGLQGLMEMGKRLGSVQNKLNAWCAWRRARAEAIEAGLQPIVGALEAGSLVPGYVREAVEANYARWWVGRAIDAMPVLRQFVSVEHERSIEKFRKLDEEVRDITAQCIRTRVRSGLTDREDASRNSEFGVIRRELEKRARHKPLRQLISEAPNAIPQLTPCLLMSPLSIAQYLPLEQKPFDVVIFDEASQITVWDAIGAIARGRQTIVAGDPKQLPPTSFFNTGQSEDVDSEEEEDLESILDEMLGANVPSVNLSWHYRSRHESLITFSNHRYYKGGLVTFPSPVTTDAAVSLQFVGGIYDRGGSQTNRAEAEAVVAEVEKRLLDPATSKQTIGVVTFNQKQQTLILDLLDAARRKNTDLDAFFGEDQLEPVFVKNLESVQGDERDVIFFSTTFGPDSTGRIMMNFGPLNKGGGERRLNVAITRARAELKVFSSLRGEQIDLSRTAALGARDLKHFLEFADKGVRALAEATFGSVGDFDSLLESSVAVRLREKGWTLHPQVGVSSFRIDLGVVDPDAPGRYLAGIECDGATYHRSATARDRDLVRESILRNLGWEILRLWSTDYWIDPGGVIEKLDRQLRQLHMRDKARSGGATAGT